jgi:polar amino acid transport system substrate-binding protein
MYVCELHRPIHPGRMDIPRHESRQSMTFTRRVLIILLSLLLPMSAARANGQITLLVSRGGMAVTATDEPSPALIRWRTLVEQASGLRIQVRVVTMGREIEFQTLRGDTCYFSLIRSAEREEQVNWIAPLIDDQIVLVARQDDPLFRTPDDLHRVTGIRIAAKGGAVQELLRQRGFNIVAVGSHEAGLDLVASGALRLAASTLGNLNRHNQAKPDLRLVQHLNSVPVWTACARDMPAETVQRLRAALIELDGLSIMADIKDRLIQHDPAPQSAHRDTHTGRHPGRHPDSH